MVVYLCHYLNMVYFRWILLFGIDFQCHMLLNMSQRHPRQSKFLQLRTIFMFLLLFTQILLSFNPLIQFPVSLAVPVHGIFPLKSMDLVLVLLLHVPEHAPQLSHVVHTPSTEIQDLNEELNLCANTHNYRHLLWQFPVSLDVPLHGMFPL